MKKITFILALMLTFCLIITAQATKKDVKASSSSKAAVSSAAVSSAAASSKAVSSAAVSSAAASSKAASSVSSKK